MSYSKFNLNNIQTKLGLNVVRKPIFDDANIESIPLSEWLTTSLSMGEQISLVSEKARSEFIVTPILLEVLHKNNYNFSLLSGINLDIDPAKGLIGECDFIIAAKAHILSIQSPILAIIEAKDNDIQRGIPQCAAQMYAARICNEENNTSQTTIWGCVTTGTDWQFLCLIDHTIYVHLQLYYLNQVPELLGILQYIVDSSIVVTND
jgi:hypothetical protein